MGQAIVTAFAVLIVLGIFGTIFRIGKPVKPTTNGQAAAVAFVGALELVALTYLSTLV